MALPSFTDFIELMLARGYDLRASDPYGVDFLAIGAELGGTGDESWKASQVLEDRGLIECARTLGPDCTGHLTGEGLLFVEAGGRTGIIAKFREHRSVYIVNSPGATVGERRETNTVTVGRDVTNSVINVGSGSARGDFDWAAVRAAVAELRSIADQIEAAPEVKKEIVADLETAIAQLSKAKPSGTLIRAALAPILGSIDTLDKAGGTLDFLNKLHAVMTQLGTFV